MSSTDTRMILATALRQAQAAQALSAAEIARRAVVDPATVRRVLAGEPVRFSTVRLVIEALGLEWHAFLASLAAVPVEEPVAA